MGGDYKTSKIHLTGLKHLVTSRGGFQTVNNNGRIQLLLVFVSLSCSVSYLPNIQPTQNPEDWSTRTAEIREHITDFQNFFRHLGTVATLKGLTSSKSRADRPRQRFLFGPGGPLHRLLCSSPEDNVGGENVLEFHDTHRIACLLCLCATFLDLKSCASATELYLQQLYKLFIENDLYLRPNLRLLLFVLLSGDREFGV